MAKVAGDVTGTALELFGLDAETYKRIWSLHRKNRKLFHKDKLNLSFEGDYGTGNVKLLTQADEDSKEVAQLMEELNGIIKYSRNSSKKVNKRKAEVAIRNNRMTVQRYKSATQKLAEDDIGVDAVFDEKTGMMKTMREKGRDGLGTTIANNARYSQAEEKRQKDELNDKLMDLNNKKLEANNRKLSHKIGTPQFEARVHGHMAKRMAEYNERLKWAKLKENRNNPLAKAIRKAHRNKTVGGRFLNRAMAGMGRLATKLVLGTIVTAIGAAVKFLSKLPEIASNVTKLANQGSLLNLPPGLVEDYRGLSKAILGDEHTDIVQGFHTDIHSRAASVITGDISGLLGELAGVSSLGGGRAINAAADYFASPNKNVDKVTRAITNDVVRASFLRQTLQGEATDEHNAFTANIADVKGAGRTWITALFTRWQRMIEPEQNRIRALVESGEGDFTQLMIDSLETPNVMKDATPLAYNRAQEVADVLKESLAQVKSTLEGILLRILASVEPIIGFLRESFFDLLEWLNNFPGMRGMFTERLYDERQKNIIKNEENRKINTDLMGLSAQRVSGLKNKYYLSDEEAENAYKAFTENKGLSGLPVEDALELFGEMFNLKRAQKKEDEFKTDKAREGKHAVGGITPLAAGYERQRFLEAGIDRYAGYIERAATNPKLIGVAELAAEQAAVEKELKWQQGQRKFWRGNVILSEIEALQANKFTGEKYGTLDDKIKGLEGYLNAVSTLLEMSKNGAILDGASGTSIVDRAKAGAYRNDSVKAARESAETGTVRDQYALSVLSNAVKFTPEYIGHYLTRDIMGHTLAGDITVKVVMDEKEKSYKFYLIDQATNKTLGTIHETKSPTNKTYYNDNLYDPQEYYTAY